MPEHQRKKRLKKLRKRHSLVGALSEEDVMERFLISSNPHFCHYSETDRILGQTFNMLVVQDFEALTPNSMARLTECVEGGGIIVFLLPIPLTKLGDMQMDAHTKFATESHPSVSPLFNHRLALSLASCTASMVLDDKLQVKQYHPRYKKLTNQDYLSPAVVVQDTLNDSERALFSLCHTNDQISSLRSLHEALGSTQSCVVSLTSGRGRGKSAVLGLAVALGISREGPTHVVVTSPHAENLVSFFDFIGRGLEAAGLREGKDYHLVKDSSGFVTSIRISHMGKRGRVVHHNPVDHHVAASADLVVIDEAAAIPLPLVKGWMHKGTTIFMASTIQGYEGTGRSLSLKLLKELRNPERNAETGHTLREVNLAEPIRYKNGDPIEEWLNRLLCLEASEDSHLCGALPSPEECQLYEVNRSVLFGGSHGSEVFLRSLVSLFVASHYRNSPSDLLMMADAPAHKIFCLVEEKTPQKPLCVLQIALEGGISHESSRSEQEEGRRSSGDLIPWIISQQFQDHDFPSKLSARIVRIATHPDCQGVGYGRRALGLLSVYYSSPKNTDCKISHENELLWKLEEGKRDGPLEYLGVSYGLTSQLFKFWKKDGFLPLYIRQTTSEVTGEHTCVMVKPLLDFSWIRDFSYDFSLRFCSLLPTAFRHLPSPLATQVLHHTFFPQVEALNDSVLQFLCSPRSMLRLNAYCRAEVDYHLIADLLPTLVPLAILKKLNHSSFHVYNNECVLVGMGLQYKSADVVAQELQLNPSVIMGIFRMLVKTIYTCLQSHQKNSDTKRCSTANGDLSVSSGKRKNVEYLHNPKKHATQKN